MRVAGGIALDLRGGPAETKLGATDVVTEADRRAEAALVELLRAERPDDAVTGEEGADRRGAGSRRWLLDPVDGTLNYASGVPAWSSPSRSWTRTANGSARCSTRRTTGSTRRRAARGRR